MSDDGRTQAPGKPARRDFMKRGAQAAAVAGCVGLLWHVLLQRQADAASPLRPPGAKPEPDFIAACIKCGQCVQACPYDTLKLATMGRWVLTGTPTFAPRDVPCYMCQDVPCVKVCPTGALDRTFSDIDKARMGLAVVDAEHCLSYLGLRCEVCYRVCPVRDKAITLQPQQRGISKHAMFVPVVHSDACTGCGLCEKRCPTDVAAIRVVDPKSVQGRIGAHYRLGWKHVVPESAPQAGPPAVPPPAAQTAPPAATPAAKGGALDYLNQAPR